MLRVFDHSETLPKDTGDALGFAVVCERVSHIIATEQTVERERRVTLELKATVTGRRHVNRDVTQHT